tara:strand:- start:3541 stop:3939 length:399 start_codon:yes stop_codon:yes gene_type:complete
MSKNKNTNTNSSIEAVDAALEQVENPLATKVVNNDNELKQWLVNYVGAQHGPKDDNVTVEMIVHTLAKEFPEFLQVVAEENFFRGYNQALTDVDTGQKELFSDAAQEYATQSGVLSSVKNNNPTLTGRKNVK